jgi:hypothetical protein
MQNVCLLDAGAKPVDVGALLDLEHAPADELFVLLEEALDVETVDRAPAVQSELGRDGFMYAEPDAPSLAGEAAEQGHGSDFTDE